MANLGSLTLIGDMNLRRKIVLWVALITGLILLGALPAIIGISLLTPIGPVILGQVLGVLLLFGAFWIWKRNI